MTPGIREFLIDDYPAARSLWESTDGVGLSDADTLPNIAAFLRRNPGLSFVARPAPGGHRKMPSAGVQ